MLVAVEWGDFFLGVAVTVVGGLIVLAVAGLVRSALRQRGKQQRQQAQRYKDRTPFRAGLSAVASELKDCARIAIRCEQGQGHVPSEVAKLRATEWFDRRDELILLRDEDKALWDEGEEVYRHLRRSKESGDYPPRSDDLLALSSRLLGKLAQEGKPPQPG